MKEFKTDMERAIGPRISEVIRAMHRSDCRRVRLVPRLRQVASVEARPSGLLGRNC